MAFLVSPGVQVIETDLTNVVPAVSASIGGFAGAFYWGPAEEIVTVGSEKDLTAVFGAPTGPVTTVATYARSFLTAASFLKYGNNLKVVRAINASSKNATSGQSGASGVLIKNHTDYDTSFLDGQGVVGAWAAKYPGALGNGLGVSVCMAGGGFSTWYVNGTNGNDGLFSSQFSAAPGTSDFAAAAGSSNDELHVVVYDADGSWTGTKYTILEKFAFVSQAADAVKADGTSNYYRNVVNGSKYVWWLDHPTLQNSTAALTNAGQSVFDKIAFVTNSVPFWYTFASGADATVTTANIETAIDIFADAETVDVNLLFTAGDAKSNTPGDGTDAVLASYLIAAANARKDAIAFVSPPIEYSYSSSQPLTDILAWANQAAVSRVSYAVIDSSAVKVYDKYNDVYRWIPAAGHVAGLCANADAVADAWFSPAGYSRGQLLGITKLAFNPKQADRDSLYKASVNPIVAFPGQGTILYGDKTALTKPSAFGQIGIRRLFITLEKAIATAAKFQLFEFNDEFTQAMFRNMTEPFLRDVQGRRGLTDFKVVCDSTNNTGEVVDRNEFVASIYIKPAHSINYITLNFIATRSGVEFTELVGK